MIINATDSFYLFREDGLDGPFSPVQLRLMLDRGLVRKDDYCQPESGGPTRALREIFDDPDAFRTTARYPASLSQDLSLDPFASGTVPLMGDTLPIQTPTRESRPPNLSTPPTHPYRSYNRPQRDTGLVLDATHFEAPEETPEPETVYHGHPSILNYSRSLVTSILSVVAGTLALPLEAAATAVGAGIAFLIHIAIWIHRSSVDYLVTSRRVETISGILSRSSNEVKISDIRSINVVKSGLLGYLGIGSVEFSSAGGEGVEVRFKNISGTQKVKESVRHLQDSL